MTSLHLAEIFPQLKDYQQHFFSQQQLQTMPYFKQLSILLPQKDFSQQIKKSKRLFKLLNIKKGTVIYTSSSQSNCGYFLCHGCVKLLIKKNNRQKLQTHNKHVLHQAQQRVKYLNQQLGIATNKCQQLMNEFYQQKVLFKYLQYQQIYGQGYFGLNDMVKNNINRPFLAISTQDTVLLVIQRAHFDLTLRELEIKKQQIILKSLLQNFNNNNSNSLSQNNSSNNTSTFPSIGQQLGVKLSQVFSQFVLRTFEKDEKIYKQNQQCKFMYFIINGEVQLSKSFALQIPKKIIKDQNKPHVGKQIQIKVSRLAQKCYLGQVEHFLHSKQRQFTATAIQNNTIALQLQPNQFMKITFQFATVQRDLIISAKQKLSIASQNFFKQKNKVIKLFIQQFQNIENKKKQKILNNLLIDGDNGQQQNSLLSQANSNMFQIFSKQGVFFRDTYERLQGFDQFQQSQLNNKRAAIRKYKVQTSYTLKGVGDEKNYGHQFSKYPSVSIGRDLNDDFQPFSSKEKLLNSPKKNISIFELIGSATMTPQPNKSRGQSFSSQKDTSKQSNSKNKIKKFNHLQKDETVFKRVLIKNGRYQQDKSTYKQHIIKPIVHPKFDDIIKQCMGRKNQVIRKAIGENRQDLVKDTYQSVVGELKNKSLSISKFSNRGYSSTCKGTQQFKKKLQTFSRQNRKSDYHSSAIRNRVALQQGNLKQCIGVNEPPKSSYQKTRSNLMTQTHNVSQNNFMTTACNIESNTTYYGFGKRASSHVDLSNRGRKTATNGLRVNNGSPQKLILLNHMMKPITYSSVQY